MEVVAWASDAANPMVPPRLGRARPAKPRRSASTAASSTAARLPAVATSDRAGRSPPGDPDIDGDVDPDVDTVMDADRSVGQ